VLNYFFVPYLSRSDCVTFRLRIDLIINVIAIIFVALEVVISIITIIRFTAAV
jgi:hypothetical protein